MLSAAPPAACQEGGATPAQAPAPPPNQAAPTPQPAPAQNPVPTPPPVHAGPVIVINPAHGGTDDGARAESGLVEKNVVLIFARMLRSEFERQGFRVVMTRNDDSNPSYDDRAAVANGYRDAIFISLHVSSTGQPGTVRAYSCQFSSPVPIIVAPALADGSAASSAPAPIAAPPSPPPNGLIVWDEAQRPYATSSHRMADAVQAALAQKFSGSPQASTQFAVRDLRSVAAPALAVEVSSMSISDPNTLLAMGAPLTAAIERTIQSLRPLGSPPAMNPGTAGAK
ncbi:MAG: N-acetylmuramoyl-L-alanine amidase [Candidatus Acidiferrales bacterium]